MSTGGGHESIDLNAKKARIAVRAAAKRPIVAGPAQVFGGVTSDGGGWIIINGRVVRIPPRSPMIALAEEIANILAAESNVEGLASSIGFRI